MKPESEPPKVDPLLTESLNITTSAGPDLTESLTLTASTDLNQSPQTEAPRIEGYRLEQRLGEGSFGCVWAGVRESSGQKVAVKIIAPGAAINWKYFQHELSMLREVAEHPNIVTLIDANLNKDSAYLVMPVLGGSLSERIWPGQDKSLERSLRWFEQIAGALDYTHRKGILHCDLKPSNVLVDEEDQARVVDFGQARANQGGHHALGTIGYMPPEQIERHPLYASDVKESGPDVAWDIYALGATMYYLLTRLCPRLSDEDRQSIRTESEPVKRLALCARLQRTNQLIPIRQLNQLVDEDLAHIVEACLNLEPARRPLTGQILEDLKRRRQGHPLLCQRPWTLRYRLDRFVRKPLVAVSLLVPLLFLLFINTYLTVRAMGSLQAETYRRLRDVNGLARQAIEAGLGPGDLQKILGSTEFRHYLVTHDGQVRTGYNDPDPPARLGIDLSAPQYTRRVQGQKYLGVTSGLPGATLVSEILDRRALQAVDDLLWRNLMLNLLIVLVTAFLAVVAFRLTGGDG